MASAACRAHTSKSRNPRRRSDLRPNRALDETVIYEVHVKGFSKLWEAVPKELRGTYAGLASVMIALVFLYMIASIFIFGGELNAAILGAKRKRNGNLKVERAMRGSW